jgi:hypothetical protein
MIRDSEAPPEAPGSFSLRRGAGRWTFVGPGGHAFISLGVNHADETNLLYPHNIGLWQERYGSTAAWIRNGLEADLQEWGFTTIGATEEAVSGRQLAADGGLVDIAHTHGWPVTDYASASLPYCVPLRPLEIEAWNAFPAYRDPRDPGFAEYCDYLARRYVTPHAGRPNLLCYLLTDAPRWTGHPSGAGFPGADDRGVLFEIADAYHRTITAAIRRYDPDHLILGDRYGLTAGMPGPVLEAAKPHVDAWAVQVFTGASDERLSRSLDTLDALHEDTGKPILIADTGNWCATPTSPHRASDIPDQAGRARRYITALSAYASRPWFLGSHWCGYIENPARGVGMKDPYDQPYRDFVEPVAEANPDIAATLGHENSP